jgi:hypothetical protein
MKIWIRTLLLSLLPLAAHTADLPDGVTGIRPPQSQKLSDGKQAYQYPEALVVLTPTPSGASEDIVIYQNLPTGAAKDTTLRIPNDVGNFFAGVSGDAAFIISQTGPDATLFIYSLSKKKSMFSGGFREPARVRGNSVEFEKLVKDGLNSLTPAEAKAYPKIAKLMSQGLSAGWFQKVRINLENYTEDTIGKPTLHEMQ